MPKRLQPCLSSARSALSPARSRSFLTHETETTTADDGAHQRHGGERNHHGEGEALRGGERRGRKMARAATARLDESDRSRRSERACRGSDRAQHRRQNAVVAARRDREGGFLVRRYEKPGAGADQHERQRNGRRGGIASQYGINKNSRQNETDP